MPADTAREPLISLTVRVSASTIAALRARLARMADFNTSRLVDDILRRSLALPSRPHARRGRKLAVKDPGSEDAAVKG